jgi:hypothetical protein
MGYDLSSTSYIYILTIFVLLTWDMEYESFMGDRVIMAYKQHNVDFPERW